MSAASPLGWAWNPPVPITTPVVPITTGLCAYPRGPCFVGSHWFNCGLCGVMAHVGTNHVCVSPSYRYYPPFGGGPRML